MGAFLELEVEKGKADCEVPTNKAPNHREERVGATKRECAQGDHYLPSNGTRPCRVGTRSLHM